MAGVTCLINLPEYIMGFSLPYYHLSGFANLNPDKVLQEIVLKRKMLFYLFSN